MPRIDFLPHLFNPYIRKQLHCTDRFLINWGGRDSGKSQGVAQKLIIDCLEQPYFRHLLVKKTYNSIKDSQYQTIKDIVNEWKIDHLFEFVESPLEIRCVNGNKFIARGCDKPEKIKSTRGLTGAWYEEANELTYNEFTTISLTIRGSDQTEYLQEQLTFNPEFEGDAQHHWIWDMFDPVVGKTKRGKNDVKVGNDKITYSYTICHTTYRDNHFITADRIARLEELRQRDPYYADVYCDGVPGQRKAVNPFAHQYNPDKHESASVVFQPHMPINLIIDWNLNPFAMIFTHIWRDKEGWHRHQFDELTIEEGSLQKAIELIKLKYGRYLRAIQITGDYGGTSKNLNANDRASYFDTLQRGLGISSRQLKLVPNPRHATSRDQVNYVLYYFDDWKINPESCPNTCRDMRSVECDATGSIIKKDRKKITQRADHIDCVRYEANTFLYEWISKHQRGIYK